MLLHVTVTVTLFALGHAHLCLLAPPQRGNMTSLNKAASPDCGLTKAPCGGRNVTTHYPIGLGAGEDFEFIWQKNLDHFNATEPGYFSIKIGRSPEHMMEIFRTPDTNASSLALYTKFAHIPREHDEGPHILQATYVTNNPKAPEAFYQCADVIVVRPPHPGPGK